MWCVGALDGGMPSPVGPPALKPLAALHARHAKLCQQAASQPPTRAASHPPTWKTVPTAEEAREAATRSASCTRALAATGTQASATSTCGGRARAAGARRQRVRP